MTSIVRDGPVSRQVKQPQLCPWCLLPSDSPGVCPDCTARIKLANSARNQQVVVLPVAALWDASIELQVFALLQDDGAIGSWVRPNLAGYAEQLDRSYSAIGRAMRKMVKMGWLEIRGSAPHDYRLAIPTVR